MRIFSCKQSEYGKTSESEIKFIFNNHILPILDDNNFGITSKTTLEAIKMLNSSSSEETSSDETTSTVSQGKESIEFRECHENASVASYHTEVDPFASSIQNSAVAMDEDKNITWQEFELANKPEFFSCNPTPERKIKSPKLALSDDESIFDDKTRSVQPFKPLAVPDFKSLKPSDKLKSREIHDIDNSPNYQKYRELVSMRMQVIAAKRKAAESESQAAKIPKMGAESQVNCANIAVPPQDQSGEKVKPSQQQVDAHQENLTKSSANANRCSSLQILNDPESGNHQNSRHQSGSQEDGSQLNEKSTPHNVSKAAQNAPKTRKVLTQDNLPKVVETAQRRRSLNVTNDVIDLKQPEVGQKIASEMTKVLSESNLLEPPQNRTRKIIWKGLEIALDEDENSLPP